MCIVLFLLFTANHRLLTHREEKIIGSMIQAPLNHTIGKGIDNDMQYQNRAILLLVSHNIRFAEKMTRDVVKHSYWAHKIPKETLRNEAILGLGAAAKKYDGRIRFASFAGVYVRDHLLRAITRRRQELGYVLNHKEIILLNRAKKTRHVLEKSLAREPTDEEVAAAIGVSSRRIARLVEKEKIRIISGVNDDIMNKWLPLRKK
jgi:DNA-directed RNA polymerase sigma subunit (sigma70/sigma32)